MTTRSRSQHLQCVETQNKLRNQEQEWKFPSGSSTCSTSSSKSSYIYSKRYPSICGSVDRKSSKSYQTLKQLLEEEILIQEAVRRILETRTRSQESCLRRKSRLQAQTQRPRTKTI